nr:activating signal cointegrator 1 complex subunit 3-like [Biomphalaria glabrata]
MVTCKITVDVALAQLVRRLIIDEIPQLLDDRAHVIETLVARTKCQVMADQSRSLGDAQRAISNSRNKQLRETLAWGVNLPAHAVIIKGTQIYDAKQGSFVDLGILDVMQIFGRTGRPQFDTFGHGTILTTHDKLSHYLSLMTRQNPIESQFINSLTDNLNAEISLGTVTNIEEAVTWLSYTYLFVRMRKNPLVYEVSTNYWQDDPQLEMHHRELIISVARSLDKARMIRFEERAQFMFATDVGRTASNFYIKYDTVEIINEQSKPIMTEGEILNLVSSSQEFDQIKVREDEMDELDRLTSDGCEMVVFGGKENSHGKVNILLQSYISRCSVDSFSLVSDMAYIAQNAARILRALFEMAIKNSSPIIMASRLLEMCKMVDKRLWGFENPMRQFSMLSPEILTKLENKRLLPDKMKEMDSKDIEPFWIWVEGPDTNHIYHTEYFLMHKKQVLSQEQQHSPHVLPASDTAVAAPSSHRLADPTAASHLSIERLAVSISVQVLPLQSCTTPSLSIAAETYEPVSLKEIH